MIFLKKIKNTFLTPYWNSYYIKKNNIITENDIIKFNKYKSFLLKYLWFFPNLESHKYWYSAKKNDKHGFDKYLKPNKDAKIFLNEIIKRTKDKESKILDLCCNVGRHLNILKKSGYKNLYGFDVNALAIKKMKTLFKNLNRIQVAHSPAESYLLKTQDNFFDIIFTHGATVELIPSTFSLIKEVSRVTNDLAIFLIQENGHAYPRFWRYEFRKNNMNLIYDKKLESGLSLLVFKKNYE